MAALWTLDNRRTSVEAAMILIIRRLMQVSRWNEMKAWTKAVG